MGTTTLCDGRPFIQRLAVTEVPTANTAVLCGLWVVSLILSEKQVLLIGSRLFSSYDGERLQKATRSNREVLWLGPWPLWWCFCSELKFATKSCVNKSHGSWRIVGIAVVICAILEIIFFFFRDALYIFKYLKRKRKTLLFLWIISLKDTWPHRPFVSMAKRGSQTLWFCWRLTLTF